MHNKTYELIDTERLFSDELRLTLHDMGQEIDVVVVVVFDYFMRDGMPTVDRLCIYDDENNETSGADLENVCEAAVSNFLQQNSEYYLELERQSQFDVAYDSWVDSSLLD